MLLTKRVIKWSLPFIIERLICGDLCYAMITVKETFCDRLLQWQRYHIIHWIIADNSRNYWVRRWWRRREEKNRHGPEKGKMLCKIERSLWSVLLLFCVFIGDHLSGDHTLLVVRPQGTGTAEWRTLCCGCSASSPPSLGLMDFFCVGVCPQWIKASLIRSPRRGVARYRSPITTF